MNRPRFSIVFAVLLVTSGCLGVLTGQESLVFEAQSAVVDESVAGEAGYGTNGTRTVAVNETVGVAGVDRTVTAKNRITTYEKSLDFGPLGEAKLGTVAVISTPAVEVAGREFNPVGNYDNDQLIGLVQSRYGGLSDVDSVGTRRITVLGERTEVTKYEAKAAVGGQQIDVYVHVTKLRHEDDFVLAIGVYPRILSGEEATVLDMMRAIEHPADSA